jgi:hypothetical protein
MEKFKPLGKEDLEGIAASAETFDPKHYPVGSLRALLADIALSALHYLDLAQKHKELAQGYEKLRSQNRAAQAAYRQRIRDEAAARGLPAAQVKRKRAMLRKGESV